MKPHKWMLGLILVSLMASLTITFAAGTSANLTWIAPTTYTDGTAIGSGDIDHYTITWAPDPNTPGSGPSGSLTVKAPALATTVPVACGSTQFKITVTTGAMAVYPNATSSPAGPVGYATGITCAPNPPSGLAVQ